MIKLLSYQKIYFYKNIFLTLKISYFYHIPHIKLAMPKVTHTEAIGDKHHHFHLWSQLENYEHF